MLANDEALRERHATLADYREGALKAPLKFRRARKYSYASMGILLSAEIAQKITGKPIADLVEERVFKPLGMQRTGYGLRRPRQCVTVPSQAAPAMTEGGKKSWTTGTEQRILAQPWGALGRALGSAADSPASMANSGTARPHSEARHEQMMIVNQSPAGVKASGLGFDLPPSVGSPACGSRTFGHNGSTGTLS